jgi:hypothetical protein
VATSTPGAAASPTAGAGATGALNRVTGNAEAPKIYFGTDDTVAAKYHPPAMSRHVYSQIDDNVPTARMITMGSAGLKWTQISSAEPGSAAYKDLVRWADTLKTRPGPIFLAFGHEPEAKGQAGLGTASQYVAAYRHVFHIFRVQGVTNVQWTWQMTGYAFVVKSSDPRYAQKWYPGDYFVDDVASDDYNWAECRGYPPNSLAAGDTPALDFAKAHGKGAVLGEFGTGPGPARAGWLAAAEKFLIANRSTFRAAYYFDDPGEGGCDWQLTSSADLDALFSIARNDNFSSS